jgi:hypothetical protein
VPQAGGEEVPGQFAQRVLTSASKPNDTGKMRKSGAPRLSQPYRTR